MVVVGFGRSGTTMLQHALNETEGVVVRGENYNLPFTLWLAYTAAAKAKDLHGADTTSDRPWYGAGDIPLGEVLAGLRNLMLDCVIRPGPETQLCGWKEVRHIPGLSDDSIDDRRHLPASFDELAGYLAFLDLLLPGVRFLINSRHPSTACNSSWWAENRERSANVLGIANQWFDSLPPVLGEKLGEERCFRVRYEEWSLDSRALEPAWHFLGLPFDRQRMSRIFRRRVN